MSPPPKIYYDWHPHYRIGPLRAWKVGDEVELPTKSVTVRIYQVAEDGMAYGSTLDYLDASKEEKQTIDEAVRVAIQGSPR